MPDDLASILAGIRDDNIDSYADGSTSDIPRLLAALEAVLKLADDWEAKAKKIGGQIALEDCDGAVAGFKMIGYQNHRDHAAALRAAITAALAGEESS